MAATITDGLNSMAKADLSGLRQRIDKLREDAEKIKLQTESSTAHESFIAALKRAKEVSL